MSRFTVGDLVYAKMNIVYPVFTVPKNTKAIIHQEHNYGGIGRMTDVYSVEWLDIETDNSEFYRFNLMKKFGVKVHEINLLERAGVIDRP